MLFHAHLLARWALPKRWRPSVICRLRACPLVCILEDKHLALQEFACPIQQPLSDLTTLRKPRPPIS